MKIILDDSIERFFPIEITDEQMEELKEFANKS